MFGDTAFSPETILAGPSLVESPPQFVVAFVGVEGAPQLPAPPPVLVPYDQWGLTQIPTSSGLPFTPLAAINGTSLWLGDKGQLSPFPVEDPCLGVILDFLATWLVTDQTATAAWKAVVGAADSHAVRRIFAHDPKTGGFSASNLPALYMWRESAKQSWQADDWFLETTVVKSLWLYPLGVQTNQKVRQTFAGVLSKLIGAGIERGRTPSWVQPGDPDRQATRLGSLFYPFANFHTFELDSWRNGRLDVESTTDGQTRFTPYPAIEFTFNLIEKLDYGLGRFPIMPSVFDTVFNPQGRPVVSGFLDH